MTDALDALMAAQAEVGKYIDINHTPEAVMTVEDNAVVYFGNHELIVTTKFARSDVEPQNQLYFTTTGSRVEEFNRVNDEYHYGSGDWHAPKYSDYIQHLRIVGDSPAVYTREQWVEALKAKKCVVL